MGVKPTRVILVFTLSAVAIALIGVFVLNSLSDNSADITPVEDDVTIDPAYKTFFSSDDSYLINLPFNEWEILDENNGYDLLAYNIEKKGKLSVYSEDRTADISVDSYVASQRQSLVNIDPTFAVKQEFSETMQEDQVIHKLEYTVVSNSKEKLQARYYIFTETKILTLLYSYDAEPGNFSELAVSLENLIFN
jgi:hypothetical protein